ncbi:MULTISPECIES: hypothetical protein [Microcystis]|nr:MULTISPECIES: hypothetical protein [Microcystis]
MLRPYFFSKPYIDSTDNLEIPAKTLGTEGRIAKGVIYLPDN